MGRNCGFSYTHSREQGGEAAAELHKPPGEEGSAEQRAEVHLIHPRPERQRRVRAGLRAAALSPHCDALEEPEQDAGPAVGSRDHSRVLGLGSRWRISQGFSHSGCGFSVSIVTLGCVVCVWSSEKRCMVSFSLVPLSFAPLIARSCSCLAPLWDYVH